MDKIYSPKMVLMYLFDELISGGIKIFWSCKCKMEYKTLNVGCFCKYIVIIAFVSNIVRIVIRLENQIDMYYCLVSKPF